VSGRGLSRRGALLAALVTLAALSAAVGVAGGEEVQRGDLIVSLDGELSPLTLPRHELAPVAVELSGRLRTTDGAPPPQVSRFELRLPRQARIDRHGLPSCPVRRLAYTTSAEAMAACGAALIGHGTLGADVKLPNQSPFPVQAQVLAFNTRVGGRPGIVLHAFSANPPTAIVVPFAIRKGSGRLGIRLVAHLTKALGPWPRITAFDVRLFRRFPRDGGSASYLSASCPIPKGLTAGFLSLAQLSLAFPGGEHIGVGIARSCRAPAVPGFEEDLDRLLAG
jgi:hypothetical protein